VKTAKLRKHQHQKMIINDGDNQTKMSMSTMAKKEEISNKSMKKNEKHQQ